MDRTIYVLRRSLAIILAIIMLLGSAAAEGLFPSMNKMFGIAMPSIGAALDRTVDETSEDAEGKKYIYSTFSYDDYLSFGVYLAGVGAVLTDSQVTESTIIADLTVHGASMQLIYNWSMQRAEVIYPSGTRPETEKEAIKKTASILPSVGGIMPSAQFAADRSPDSEESVNGGILQIWNNYTDEEYIAFSNYLAETGATLKESSSADGVLTAVISLNTYCFTFVYNWYTKMASVFYPAGTSPERDKRNVLTGKGSILPEMKTVGRNLPSMSQALSRLPDAEETQVDGSTSETYNHFDEEDYKAFSRYLQASGCVVDDYHVENGSIIVTHLSNITGEFTFSYDTLRHIGKVVYPRGSRIEAAWIAPTTAPEPVVTSKPGVDYYSESSCWVTAKNYFMNNIRWNDPNSITIHNHSANFSNSDDTYTFIIDYSARVVAGGLKRSTYYITVSAITDQVTMAFGGN